MNISINQTHVPPFVRYVTFPPNTVSFLPIGNHRNNAPNTFPELILEHILIARVFQYSFDVDSSHKPIYCLTQLLSPIPQPQLNQMIKICMTVYYLSHTPTLLLFKKIIVKYLNSNCSVLLLPPIILPFPLVQIMLPPFRCGTATENYLFINSSFNLVYNYHLRARTFFFSSLFSPTDQFHIMEVDFVLFLDKQKKSFFLSLLDSCSIKRVQTGSTYVYVFKD